MQKKVNGVGVIGMPTDQRLSLIWTSPWHIRKRSGGISQQQVSKIPSKISDGIHEFQRF